MHSFTLRKWLHVSNYLGTERRNQFTASFTKVLLIIACPIGAHLMNDG